MLLAAWNAWRRGFALWKARAFSADIKRKRAESLRQNVQRLFIRGGMNIADEQNEAYERPFYKIGRAAYRRAPSVAGRSPAGFYEAPGRRLGTGIPGRRPLRRGPSF
ncbi:hypothetical protein SDC9_203278 [bioreactor metagenome]|uniref:Uncharacterized protein n=1 Tax=bioreactor metagenome TaxID=1076179 RepID=A0A645J537_9ZZZZ